MHIVVTYDVAEDYKRTRLMIFLKGYLEHVQKSVFEGEIGDRDFDVLRTGIRDRIDSQVDSVRIYSLCRRCQGVTEVIGTGVYVEVENSDILL